MIQRDPQRMKLQRRLYRIFIGFVKTSSIDKSTNISLNYFISSKDLIQPWDILRVTGSQVTVSFFVGKPVFPPLKIHEVFILRWFLASDKHKLRSELVYCKSLKKTLIRNLRLILFSAYERLCESRLFFTNSPLSLKFPLWISKTCRRISQY